MKIMFLSVLRRYIINIYDGIVLVIGKMISDSTHKTYLLVTKSILQSSVVATLANISKPAEYRPCSIQY